MSPDILVIGGGSAGVGAALAAARRGAEVWLVERGGYLGGAGTSSLVHSFCGLYDLIKDSETPAQVANGGIVEELERELRAQGIGHGPVRMGKVDVLLHEPQRLALFFDQWCAREPNLKVLLHTEVAACAVKDGRVAEVTLLCRGKSWQVRPRQVVDASGDAVLAELTGHPWERTPSQELQRPAYIVGLSGVGSNALAGNGPFEIAGQLAKGIKERALSTEAAGAHFRASGAAGEIFLTLDLAGDGPGRPFDATDPHSLTLIEVRGREVAFAIVDYLKTELEAFARARISVLPMRAGIRESRRWVGEAVLTEQDLLESREDELTVAKATWPMELRETARGPRLVYPYVPKGCGIPLGALRARDLRNVFIAGRCISATHRAQASIRVMGTALATGQAAGIAATCNEEETSLLASVVRRHLGLAAAEL